MVNSTVGSVSSSESVSPVSASKIKSLSSSAISLFYRGERFRTSRSRSSDAINVFSQFRVDLIEPRVHFLFGRLEQMQLLGRYECEDVELNLWLGAARANGHIVT